MALLPANLPTTVEQRLDATCSDCWVEMEDGSLMVPTQHRPCCLWFASVSRTCFLSAFARSASCIDAWLSCGRTARGAARPPGPMLLPARPLGPGAALAAPLCPPSVCSSCACAAKAADAEPAPKLAPAPLAAGCPASCSRFKYPDLRRLRELDVQAHQSLVA